MRGVVCALWVTSAAFVSIACQSIVGIEDHVFDEKRVDCERYCTAMDDKCQEELGEQGYSSHDTCVDVCLLMDHETSELGGNTLACRESFLKQIAQPDDAHEQCQAAGPGGGDGKCGSLCENYCALFEAVCEPIEDCVTKCEGLPKAGDFNPQTNYDGDTVECRIVHASAAAGGDKIHCDHAKFVSTLHCFNPPNASAEDACSALCDTLDVACEGPFRVYENKKQCVATCNAMPDKGTFGDHEGNTVGCRYYHAQNALLGPETHCAHAGPGGDGHCGGSSSNCDSYCSLVQVACEAEFDETYADFDACVEECKDLDGSKAESKYGVDDAETRDAFSCRMLYTARTLAGASACEAALGQSAPCDAF